MAPSRRKGASKAAAAAAACSKWKIGDLVLAKVKGFPAWPARVSEPKNWGFKEDLKKVFVYFFGTEQIAFCAPADVELFTEEKKASLLGKRHGKGADFSLAVNEIIDSYNELKEKEQVVDDDCPNEIAEINEASSGSFPGNKMVESLHKSRLKEEDIPPVLVPELKIAGSTGEDSDFTSLADAAVSELEKNNMLEHGMLTKEPGFNVVVTYSSRRKLENMQIADCATQGRAQPVRRSRSSRVDTSRLDNLMPFHANDSSNGDVAFNISRDITGRRSKRPRRSPDGSGRRFISSPALISNGSIEENGADTATISDCSGFDDEMDVDFACSKSLAAESADHCRLELESSRKIDFQSNASIFRKKRKPNRKRTGNGTGLDKFENFDLDISKNGHALPSEHVKLSDHISKENGDKHLPLVKRARARMGSSPCQLPAAGEQTDCQAADKMLDISKESSSLNCEENDSANCNSLTDRENDSANSNSHANREVGNLSPLNVSASKKLQSWEVKKSQPFSGLVDGEAALPPSKRLHRALEAMSANAAEDGRTSSDNPAVLNISVDGYSSSYSGVCHKVTVDSRAGVEVGSSDAAPMPDPSISEETFKTSEELAASGRTLDNVTVDSRAGVEVGSSDDAPMPDPSISEETVKTSEELAANGRTLDNDDRPIGDFCHDVIEDVEPRELKDFSASSFKTHSCDTKNPKQDPNVFSVAGASLELDCGSPNCRSPALAVHLSDNCKAESSESAKTSVEPDSRSDNCKSESSESAKTSVEPDSRSVDMSVDPANGKESSLVSLQQDTSSHLSSEENLRIETVVLPKISSEEDRLNRTM